MIFRIIEHALEDGLIQPGQTILDPFGGVALGALPALQNGLNWIGVELEPKFVELGRQNIALWNGRFSGMPKWTGNAILLQGDSRRLAEVVSAPGLVVGSPPYAEQPTKNGGALTGWEGKRRIGASQNGNEGYGSTPGQLANLPPGDIAAVIASPPFAGNTGGRGDASRNGIDSALFDRHSGGMKGGTGSDPANLDHLPMGTPPIAIVSSSPYAEGLGHDAGHPRLDAVEDKRRAEQGSGRRNGYGQTEGQLGGMAIVSSPPFVDSVGSDDPDKRGGLFRDAKRRNDTNLTGTYGETEGQLGGMKAGDLAIVGSPPFENSLDRGVVDAAARRDFARANGVSSAEYISPIDMEKVGLRNQPDYGSTAGQIGATQGDTFWAAARTILLQCYEVLPPGAAAIWVLKDYVKAGKVVPFALQWQQLCEACGFETAHVHRAMLVKENGEQETMAAGHDTTGTTTNLLGEEVTTEGKPMMNKKNRIQRKSFFRLLAEKKGAPPIDFETVLCTVKR